YFLTTGWDRFGIFSEYGFTVNKRDIGRKRTHICTSPEMLKFVIKAWHALTGILRENKFDRVHVFFGVPTGLLIFHPGLKNSHVTLWAGGSDVPWHNKERFWLLYAFLTPVIKRIWKKAAAVICNSSDLRGEVLRFSPGLQVKVLYNGIDTDSFHPAETVQPPRPFTVLCAGRLIPFKRTETIIRAAALLKAAGRKMRVRIAGEGSERAALENLASTLAVTDTVEFLGGLPREKMPQLYRESDVFAHMSRTEGMCNSVLEAMATALPVISSDTGDAGDLLQDCGTALADGTPEAFARSITRYMQDAGLRAAHGQAARAKTERMSWEQSAGKYLALLERADAP
ncbi:MAG: glycosyltransferase family 4 protein, partial [Elusimicrobiaceae bacterium]|nr:glycosyltransferase family 4 protein [Elusimicrobiaceae bacterium]